METVYINKCFKEAFVELYGNDYMFVAHIPNKLTLRSVVTLVDRFKRLRYIKLNKFIYAIQNEYPITPTERVANKEKSVSKLTELDMVCTTNDSSICYDKKIYFTVKDYGPVDRLDGYILGKRFEINYNRQVKAVTHVADTYSALVESEIEHLIKRLSNGDFTYEVKP